MAAVAVPKATMYEQGKVSARKNDVRRSRQVFAMQPEAIAQAMQKPPHSPFWACVFASDSPHGGATLFRRSVIDHYRQNFSNICVINQEF